MENQQGPAVQHRELCSILCDYLMVSRGEDGGRDSQGVWDGHGHTAVFNLKTQGPAVLHRELCSMSCGSLGGRDVWGGMDTCTCTAKCLHCPPETNTTVLISYTSIKNKKLKKKKKYFPPRTSTADFKERCPQLMRRESSHSCLASKPHRPARPSVRREPGRAALTS